MRIVTVARRPCEESGVTQNVLRHQAGALNIDATRIGTGDGGTREGEQSATTRYSERGATNFSALPGPRGGSASGRWPKNSILQHDASCRSTGSVRVEGYRINRWKDGAKPFGGGAGHAYDSEAMPDEEVLVWDCTESCVVRGLAEQSSVGVPEKSRKEGGTARFFKQVQPIKQEIPEGLWGYLITLIAPPPGCTPLIIAEENLGSVEFTQHHDRSVHGLITVGDPTPWLAEIHRVLRPGAHVLLISDDSDSTGATGACAIEDFGYEIRDAIAVFDHEGEFNYQAKTSTRERNEGVLPRDRITCVEMLFPLPGEDIKALRDELTESVEASLLQNLETEGLPVGEVPEDMLESFELRRVDRRRVLRNDHPCLKSIGIMSSLLEGTPPGSLVVDPFHGSGTTGISALLAGFDFVGIEQEGEYLTITDQRVRHWDRKVTAWDGATIESEAKPFENETKVLGDIFDLFGSE